MNGLIPIGGYVEEVKCSSPRSLTVSENLREQKKHLEERLARVTAALEALEKNPEFTACLELVQKAF